MALLDLVNQLTYPKPPPPPIKMRVEDYIELLGKIKESDEKTQQEVSVLLTEYHQAVDVLASELAKKLLRKFGLRGQAL
jgi:hypothetical protein